MKKHLSLLLLIGVALTAVVVFLWSWREPPPPRRAVEPPRVAPVAVPAVPDQPATAPSETGNSSRKFAAMDVLERSAILDEIEKLDFASVLRIYRIEAGRVDKDLMKQGSIAMVLGNMMRERTPSPEVFAQIREFIAHGSYTIPERGMLIGALGSAQTKESVELLLSVASTLSHQELKQSAILTVRRVDGIWGDGAFHEELSPPLERTWREAQDQELLISVAVAIASVGASNGINLLLNSALYDVGRDEVRARAAAGALGHATILNPNAVPPVAAVLMNQPPGSAASKLASDTLAATGIPAAGRALVTWLQYTDGSAAPLAQHYVQNARSSEILEVWESSLSPVVPFRNEKNREAVREGLTQRRTGIKHESTK